MPNPWEQPNKNKDKKPDPSPELIKTPEVKKVTRDSAIIALRVTEGVRTESGLDVFKQWYDQEYERMVQNEISAFEFNWGVAQVQISAGKYREAVSTLNDLADAMWSEQDQEAVDKCNQEIDRVNRMVSLL